MYLIWKSQKFNKIYSIVSIEKMIEGLFWFKITHWLRISVSNNMLVFNVQRIHRTYGYKMRYYSFYQETD